MPEIWFGFEPTTEGRYDVISCMMGFLTSAFIVFYDMHIIYLIFVFNVTMYVLFLEPNKLHDTYLASPPVPFFVLVTPTTVSNVISKFAILSLMLSSSLSSMFTLNVIAW